MDPTKTLENLARRFLPPSAAREAKRVAVWPRYWAQRAACRRGFREYGSRYPHPVLFVAGLPKSGTTWLEKMLSSFPGFHELLIPEVASHELRTGGSHDFELPDDMFERFRGMLVLTKMHAHGSAHNAGVLKRAGVPYVVLYRDLRDVAVSNYFYVRNTPWHPEYPLYAPLPLQEGLRVFSERTLPAYAAWVRSWRDNRDPEASLMLRYEDMLADARGSLTRIAALFGLDDSLETIGGIVEAHSFERMSGGRERGQDDAKAFVRKGVAGDWRNHFDDALRRTYKSTIGEFLVEFGYEAGLDW